jgi:hypothetical protein
MLDIIDVSVVFTAVVFLPILPHLCSVEQWPVAVAAECEVFVQSINSAVIELANGSKVKQPNS